MRRIDLLNPLAKKGNTFTFADALKISNLSTKSVQWDKVSFYSTNKEKYITNEKVRKIIKNPDTSKVSRILRKWVEQGLLIKIDTGAKKTIKYRLPIDEEREYLFANYNANKK